MSNDSFFQIPTVSGFRLYIGVGRFRILGGGGGRGGGARFRILGGGARGAKFPAGT